MSFQDYYSMLGVPRFYATQEEIRAAYLAQIRYFHPDAANVSPEIAQRKTQELNQAYATLRDSEKKRAYDEQLTKHIQADEETKRRQREQQAQQQVAKWYKEANKVKEQYPSFDFRTELQNEEFLNLLKAGVSVLRAYEMIHMDEILASYTTPSPKKKPKRRIGTALKVCIVAAIIFFAAYPQALDPVIDHFQPKETESPLPIPYAVENGRILEYPQSERLAPLSIETTGSKDYYIFLDSISASSHNDMAFYVKGGKTVEVLVPLGTYNIFYAVGTQWYGKAYLFGDSTARYKCDGTFEFYDDGNYYQGWTLELYEQINGNLDTDPVSEDEFPG